MTTSTLQCSPLWFHFHYPITKLDLAASGDKEAKSAMQNNLFSSLNKQQFYKNFVLLNSTSYTVQSKKRFFQLACQFSTNMDVRQRRNSLIFNKESVFLRL
jgi:hypothetical protein